MIRKSKPPVIRTLSDLRQYRSGLEEELQEVEKSLSGRYSALRELLSFQKILQSVVEEISRIKNLIISIIEIVQSFFSRRKKKKRPSNQNSTSTIQPPEE